MDRLRVWFSGTMSWSCGEKNKKTLYVKDLVQSRACSANTVTILFLKCFLMKIHIMQAQHNNSEFWMEFLEQFPRKHSTSPWE